MANRVRLTDRVVAGLKCPPDKTMLEITDATGSLTIWLGRSGTKLFKYRYSEGGKTQRLTLGEFEPGKFGVDDARIAVIHAEKARAAGSNPRAMANIAIPESITRFVTVNDVLDAYFATLKGTSAYNARKCCKDYTARFGPHPLHQHTPFQAKDWLEKNYQHRKGGARTLVRYLNSAFNKAMKLHSGIEMPPGFVNPMKDIRSGIWWWGDHQPQSHSRAFEEDEWKALHTGVAAAYQMDNVTKAGVRIVDLLMLTGARPSEIAGLKLSEVAIRGDEGWIIKAEHKTKRLGDERRIWLMEPAVRVLEAQFAENEKMRSKSVYVFPQHRQRKDQKKGHVANVNHFADIVAKAAGVSLTPYTLRGAYISFALDTLGDSFLTTVAANVGHKDPTVTLRYYRRQKESRQREAGRLVSEAMEKLRA